MKNQSDLQYSDFFYCKIKDRLKFNQRYGQLFMAGGKRSWYNYVGASKAKRYNEPFDAWGQSLVKTKKNMIAFYPWQKFKGKFLPFQQWAYKAGFFQSPLSIAIHQEYGLWMSMRAAVFNAKKPRIFMKKKYKNPCANCQTKPCINACPASAISKNQEFNYPQCLDYLASDYHSNCWQLGCQSRIACPIGKKYQNNPAKARFHWRSTKAKLKKLG